MLPVNSSGSQVTNTENSQQDSNAQSEGGGGGGLPLAEARVKGQLQDVPYSSVLQDPIHILGRDKRGPLLPSRDSSEQQKRRGKGGGRGKREWKEGVPFAQLHPDHPAPSVLIRAVSEHSAAHAAAERGQYARSEKPRKQTIKL
ncbi:hypothetical protein NQZ68_034357 [Dissostichus eleginoides]|nr:hypothetical protein NQZ68_034357 [Dissostichus eleginoides]